MWTRWNSQPRAVRVLTIVGTAIVVAGAVASKDS